VFSIWVRAVCRRVPGLRALADLELMLEERRWRRRGCPTTGPLPGRQKRMLLLQAAARGKVQSVVETGTYLGDSTYAFARAGYQVVSIEVEPRIAALAERRFRGNRSVRVVAGDSGQLLPRILSDLSAPALIWLDGHYSGGSTGRGETDTPVEREVEAVMKVAPPGSVVVIDDARCFGTDPSYPELKPWLERLKAMGTVDLEVANDMIKFVVPPGMGLSGRPAQKQ